MYYAKGFQTDLIMIPATFRFFMTLILVWLVSCGRRDVVPSFMDERSRAVELKKENGRWQFMVNGLPFAVRGGAGFTHMNELSLIGGNTIRTWDTTGLECTLNEAWGNGLKVLAGFYIPESGQNHTFYKDTARVNEMVRSLRAVVRRYRDHPALLAWCVGNELLFPVRPQFDPFYDGFNQVLKMIHEEDGGHPVTTAVSNFSRKEIVNLRLKTSGLDFLSVNTFGQLKNLEKQVASFEWFWDIPLLVSEWGASGGWESEETAWGSAIENSSTEKARAYGEMYRQYLLRDDPRILGSLVFYWGSKQEFTHTWFSVFQENGVPTEIMEELYDCWNDTVTRHRSVQLKYMLVDGLGARDNLLFRPGSRHRAEVLLKDSTEGAGFRYCWEVIKDDWLGHFLKTWKKPPNEKGFPADAGSPVLDFLVPQREGPYRIFVTVFDNRGFCATANTPFYVVAE